MPSVRIDKVIFSSQFGVFLNYKTASEDMTVSATPLANGATRTITVTIPYTREGTIADIYGTRSTVRTLLSTGGRAAARAIYSFKSTETATFNISYTSSNIVVNLVIFNGTGSAITPNAQTITVTAVQYDAPITSV